MALPTDLQISSDDPPSPHHRRLPLFPNIGEAPSLVSTTRNWRHAGVPANPVNPKCQVLVVDLDVGGLGRYWRRQLAGVLLELGGGFDEPRRQLRIGCGFRHFQQRCGCLACVIAVFGHGTEPSLFRISGGTAIPFRSESIKMYRTERGMLVPNRWLQIVARGARRFAISPLSAARHARP